MILTGPKENYCFVEVSREIRGGAQFLGKLEGVAGNVLGVEAVAATSQLELSINAETDNLQIEYRGQPVIKPRGCEIPPPNELRMPLLHRGFDTESAWRYPDTAWVKSLLKKAGLRDKLTEIAASYDQEFEGSSVWFDEVEFLPNPGRGLILGLRPDKGHKASTVLNEQADVVAQELRQLPSFGERLYRLPEPWRLAVAVARIEVAKDSDQALRLLDDIRLRLPVHMVLGDIKFSSDDIA